MFTKICKMIDDFNKLEAELKDLKANREKLFELIPAPIQSIIHAGWFPATFGRYNFPFPFHGFFRG